MPHTTTHNSYKSSWFERKNVLESLFIAFYNEYWTSDKDLLNFVTSPWFHDNRETDLITKILSKYTKTVDD